MEIGRYKQPKVPCDQRVCPMCSFKIGSPPGLKYFDALDAIDERLIPVRMSTT